MTPRFTFIPLIANGTVDLECGSTTNNLERQQQVSFTITHFVTSNRFVSKKAGNIKNVDDPAIEWKPDPNPPTAWQEDLVIVDTPDALLVARRDRAQDVSQVVKWLEERRREDLL